MAALSLVCMIPAVGSLLGLPVKLTLKYGGAAVETLIKYGKKYAPELIEAGGKLAAKVGKGADDVFEWSGKKFAKNGGKTSNNPSALRYNGDGTWTSNEGIIYGQGSKDGNRVRHILQHTQPNPTKPLHTVFNVDKSEVIGLIDEAWINKGTGVLQSNGKVLYDVNMGKVIGTNSEETIRIITQGYSNNIVTAFLKGVD